MMPTTVFLKHQALHIGHGGIRPNPAMLNVGEVETAVLTLLLIVKTGGAPEGLDVTKNFSPEAIHTGHPVTVQAPDEVAADQPLEPVTAHIDPFPMTIVGEANQPDQQRVEDDLAQPDQEKDGQNHRGDPEGRLVAPGAHKAVENLHDPRTSGRLPVGKLMDCRPEPQGGQLSEHDPGERPPTSQQGCEHPGDPGEQRDQQVETWSLFAALTQRPTGLAESSRIPQQQTQQGQDGGADHQSA
jgi:hypothetical protein